MLNQEISYELRARLALERSGFRTAHSLGQNFILDEGFLDDLLTAAELGAGDRVLEIGMNGILHDVDENCPGTMKRYLRRMVYAMRIWHARYLAAERDNDPEIAAMLRRVPFDTPRTFREAVQSAMKHPGQRAGTIPPCRGIVPVFPYSPLLSVQRGGTAFCARLPPPHHGQAAAPAP